MILYLDFEKKRLTPSKLVNIILIPIRGQKRLSDQITTNSTVLNTDTKVQWAFTNVTERQIVAYSS